MYISTPVVIDGTLFGRSHRFRGQYFALDGRTGAVLWLGPPRAAQNTAVDRAGNLLFLLNDDAELMVGGEADQSSMSWDPTRWRIAPLGPSQPYRAPVFSSRMSIR